MAEQTYNRNMKVIKRDGTREDVSFDKVIRRIKLLCDGVIKQGTDATQNMLQIDPIKIAQKVINEIRDGITTTELDEFAARTSASMLLEHPDYGVLAARIIISNHHKNTIASFSDTMRFLYEKKDHHNASTPLIDRVTYKVIINNRDKLDAAIDYSKDYNIDYFGFKTLEKSYLIKYTTGQIKVMERPQHMWMRVAIGIHGADIDAAIETYRHMADGKFIHATPTLFNSGTPRPQLSSCFLLGIHDSIEGIYKCLSDCAKISKWAGGIGIHISNIRASQSIIRGTNGVSNGIVPMLKVFNETARYVDQCFAPDTLLYTPKGPVEISKLAEGDCVITHTGNVQKIEKVLRHEVNSEVLQIKTKYSINPVVVTCEHQVLVLRDNHYYTNNNYINTAQDYETLCKRLDNGYASLEWSDAKDLNIGDYVCFPKDAVEQCNSQNDHNTGNRGDFTWNNISMTPVIDINRAQYNGYLYDLEVENDHTYITANLGIVHNGGGKRMGSIAIYLEPYHAEFLSFLELKKGKGNENEKARDLFYAVYMNDLFMKRLEEAIKPDAPKVYWTLMCPDECPGLSDVYGDEFTKLYTKYESEGKGREKVNILKVWKSILDAQKETGTPYIVYKDHVNNKSNQKNIGVIKSSNLCTEITEYSDTDEYAVCNLASVGLSKHVKMINGKLGFDHDELFNTVKIMTKNLNKIIDINYYPVPETKKSNLRHRPIGLGVQGLADVFQLLRYPFESDEAYKLNQEIFETIYYGALWASNEVAEKQGSYETYQGSPASQGLLQFDLWKLNGHIDELPLSGRWDWDALRAKIAQHGLRNSLLVAPMPTASTAQILGNNECFEPYTYNIYVRKVLAGDYTIINKHLHKDLCDRGIWSEQMKRELIKHRGSVQNIPEIPNDMKELYKTSFEIKQKALIDMSAGRGCFIDQSQSLNLFLDDPTDNKLTAMHLYSWKKGLKTGIYYLRRESITKAQQFTVGPTNKNTSSVDQTSNSNNTNAAAATSANANSHGAVPNLTKTSNVADKADEDPTLNVKLCLISDPDCLACQ